MWLTFGQDHLLRQLSASLRAGRVGHAYLLAGPPHIGKMTLALDLAAAVNCAGGRQPAPMFADPDADNAALSNAALSNAALSNAALSNAALSSDALSSDALSSDALSNAALSGDSPCGNCEPCRRVRRGVHADLSVVAVGGDPRVPTRISIEQVRESENFLSVTPVEGGWKVVIFDGAETLSAGQSESANALLKTLEEPPEYVLILLLTANPDAILPTIRSRCRLLSLTPVPGAVLADYLARRHNAPPDTARWLARLARGCPGWAINALADPAVLADRAAQLERIAATAFAPLDERFAYANGLAGAFSRDRESVRQTLYLWQRWWRDLLLVKEGVADHIQNTDQQDDLTARAGGIAAADIVAFLQRIQETLVALDANANPRLALECLMLATPPD